MLKPASLRSQKGAALQFAAVLLVVLALVVVTITWLTLIQGGSQQTASAVDAGALSVGQACLKLGVQKGNVRDDDQFAELTNSSGKFTLTNINRVLAKAMIVAMNESDMRDAGLSSSSSANNSDRTACAARRIADELNRIISDPNNLSQAFGDFANRNQLNFLGRSKNVNPIVNQWSVAYTDRGVESNIRVDASAFPNIAGMSLVNKGTVTYLPGYSDLKAGNFETFRFVPFEQGQQPRLITRGQFDKDSHRPSDHDVANAIRCDGAAGDFKAKTHTASACVLTNPQDAFDMRMTHGFIRIELQPNTVRWWLNGIPCYPNGTYGYRMTERTAKFPIPLGGMGTANATLGLEIEAPNLYGALFPLGGLGTAQKNTMDRLLARAKQLSPKTNKLTLAALLAAQSIDPVTTETQTFFLYADDEGLLHLSDARMGYVPGWLKRSARADGISTDGTEIFIPGTPNRVILNVVGVVTFGPIQSCETRGTHTWTPGTGFDGCLGDLSIRRNTDVIMICTTAAPG